MQTNVLIVGGGPFGLMLANELGRRNIACLLVDSKRSTAFNPQANATQARTMEHFRRLGFVHEIRAQGLPSDHPTDIAFFTRYTKYELARLALPTAAQATEKIKRMGGSWSAAELPHRVSQKFVEQVLRKHAMANASVDLRYDWKMLEFTQRKDGISAQIAANDGKQAMSIHANYLVGADGARSGVRQALGIGWEGETGTQREFMGGKMLAVYLHAPEFSKKLKHPWAWMYMAANHERRSFMASVDGVAEYALHMALKPHEQTDAWSEAEVRRLVAQVMGAELPFEILSISTWTAGHALVAQRFQEGRVFIGGDAAHLFTPTGGLGYNTAVEDAVNLGWKLASVLRGQAPQALLESYTTERKPLAVRNTGYARTFADSVGLFTAKRELDEDSELGQAERALATTYFNAHLRREFNIPGITFGGRYDASPIIVSDGTKPPEDQANAYQATACPGGRPPHAWLDDGSSLFDAFGFEWTLLVLSDVSTKAFELAAKESGIELKVLRIASTVLLALYEGPLTLIRPDHMVAWRGATEADAQSIVETVLGKTRS